MLNGCGIRENQACGQTRALRVVDRLLPDARGAEMMREFIEMRREVVRIQLLQRCSDRAMEPHPRVGIERVIDRCANERMRETVAALTERNHDAVARSFVEPRIKLFV